MLSDRLKNITESATIAIAKKARELKKQGHKIIDLSLGEPDFPSPENVKKEAIKAILDDFTKYTDPAGIVELRQAIANKLKIQNGINIEPDCIVVSNGTKQVLFNVFLAIINPGDQVIIFAPYWVSYSEMVKLAGGEPVILETRDFLPDLNELRRNINPKTKVILINSPCNPTGAVYPKQLLTKIAQLCAEKRIFLVSDEIYENLIYDAKHFSPASLGGEIAELTITVNGVSKSYSMTGYRIGYAAANKSLAKAMAGIQSQTSSSSSSISQKAALEAISGPQHSVEHMRKEYEKRRNYVFERVKKMRGLEMKKPKGAFYAFIKINDLDPDSSRFAEKLLDYGIAVVPGVAFGAEGFIRISYAASMSSLIEAMDILEKFSIEYEVQKNA